MKSSCGTFSTSEKFNVTIEPGNQYVAFLLWTIGGVDSHQCRMVKRFFSMFRTWSLWYSVIFCCPNLLFINFFLCILCILFEYMFARCGLALNVSLSCHSHRFMKYFAPESKTNSTLGMKRSLNVNLSSFCLCFNCRSSRQWRDIPAR